MKITRIALYNVTMVFYNMSITTKTTLYNVALMTNSTFYIESIVTKNYIL